MFDCPCSAEWVAGQAGGPGMLTLQGGVRSFRASASGEVRLSGAGWLPSTRVPRTWWGGADGTSVGTVPPRTSVAGQWTIAMSQSDIEDIVELHLLEESGVGLDESQWRHHESVALWSVPRNDGENETGGTIFVDMLTDSDGDGVGDVNERLAGTSPEDPESTPGETVIDVLAVHTADFRDPAGYPDYTRTVHAINAAGAIYEDSGTNIRLNLVGASEVDLESSESGWVSDSARSELMENHGADLSVQFSRRGNCSGGYGGCAWVGARHTSRWTDAEMRFDGNSVIVLAHELGHVMGLAYSALSSETYGAWRWSMGHHMSPRWGTRVGTIMAIGNASVLGGVFSDPLADCGIGPCGVDADEFDGANSVATLDLLRFQVAARRENAGDADGDGFVDGGDAFPEDPDDWFDADKDGIGDNADPDADNDGVDDLADAFPLEPNEWADADADGIGDNADEVLEVQGSAAGSPIRDPALRLAVEAALGKEPGAPITEKDIAGLTSLHATYAGIRDLAGLELATALESLHLHENRIRDLSPLSELTGLTHLDLRKNDIFDLAPLSELSGLEVLDLSQNPIAEINPLSGLIGLRVLVLDNTNVTYTDVLALPQLSRLEVLGLAGLGISDVQALAEIPLRELNLASNRIADISALAGLANLSSLYLDNNRITDISALAGLINLRELRLSRNSIADIGALTDLVALRVLNLKSNYAISDIQALSKLTGLFDLDLGYNAISDITVLEGITNLAYLNLDNNAISDITPVKELVGLRYLGLNENRISDVAPLSELTSLKELHLNGNAVSDIAPLAVLTDLTHLLLEENHISDIGALSGMNHLGWLSLGNNLVSTLTPLEGAVNLQSLDLADNRVADVTPLENMKALRWVNLSRNAITNIGPLTDRAIFGGEASSGAYMALWYNPLDDASVAEHLPKLRSWGIRVDYDPMLPERIVSHISDPTLHSLIGDATDTLLINKEIHWGKNTIDALRVTGRGISRLAGLEAATSLQTLLAASNRIGDLSPLAALSGLWGMDLRDNRISDLGPLVSNAHFTWANLGGNPLSEKSVNEHIPALLERGVWLSASPVLLTLVAGGEPLRFRVSGYFESLLDSGFMLEASTGDESVAAVEVTDGVLVVVPNAAGRAGQANVSVTARGSDGRSETLSFAVTLVGPQIVPLFPAGSGVRQGFTRVINRGDQAAQARIVAIDDSGLRTLPLTLAVGAGEAVHFDAADLEAGNPDRGLSGSIGRGTGDWRLELESTAELDVLPFVRAADGFMTEMQDVAAVSDSVHRVHIFNPASELENASFLRLVNRGGEAAEAVITGVDDLGQSPGGEVRIEVPAGAAVTVTASELENGSPGLTGRLGDGAGRWRLEVSSEADLIVMNLLSSLDGHLANLSGGGIEPRGDGVHVVPLFLSAADPMGQQGVVRVINRSGSDGVVRIHAYDDEGYAYGPLELSLSAGHAAHFDSRDLELGNADKGLSGSAGSGFGDWRLELSSNLDIRVFAYVRAPGGFLTSVHEGAPQVGRRFEVATFYPADHVDGTSRLRIVNPGSRPAHVSIAGIDDAGESPGEVVRLSVPAGQSRTLTAGLLEAGFWESQGALGNGTGMWRLVVDCEQPIVVMNLLEGATGHLTNLSTK